MSKLASTLVKEFSEKVYDAKLKEIYLDDSRIDAERARYMAALTTFTEMYGDKEVEIYSAPGRTEVGGNHTDHQLGRVLAASVNIDTVAVVAKTDNNTVNIKSEGYRALSIDLGKLAPVKEEEGTTFTVRIPLIYVMQ